MNNTILLKSKIECLQQDLDQIREKLYEFGQESDMELLKERRKRFELEEYIFNTFSNLYPDLMMPHDVYVCLKHFEKDVNRLQMHLEKWKETPDDQNPPDIDFKNIEKIIRQWKEEVLDKYNERYFVDDKYVDAIIAEEICKWPVNRSESGWHTVGAGIPNKLIGRHKCCMEDQIWSPSAHVEDALEAAEQIRDHWCLTIAVHRDYYQATLSPHDESFRSDGTHICIAENESLSRAISLCLLRSITPEVETVFPDPWNE